MCAINAVPSLSPTPCFASSLPGRGEARYRKRVNPESRAAPWPPVTHKKCAVAEMERSTVLEHAFSSLATFVADLDRRTRQDREGNLMRLLGLSGSLSQGMPHQLTGRE